MLPPPTDNIVHNTNHIIQVPDFWRLYINHMTKIRVVTFNI